MTNPYEKLPQDLYIDIESESQRRIEEFYLKNPNIIDKLNNSEKEQIENWISISTTYEFYRLYGIEKNELKEYNDKNGIKLRDDIPEFCDLKNKLL